MNFCRLLWPMSKLINSVFDVDRINATEEKTASHEEQEEASLLKCMSTFSLNAKIRVVWKPELNLQWSRLGVH